MRQIAGCLILLLLVPFVSATALPQSDQNAGAAVPPAQSTSPNSSAQPMGGGSSQPEAFPNSPGSLRSQGSESGSPFGGQPSSLREQQAQEPVGTAAAGSVEATGVAASKPAGAAIAPAKQRRTRAILIKVGALVGASVAVGTVVALSNASPSRPPGAR